MIFVCLTKKLLSLNIVANATIAHATILAYFYGKVNTEAVNGGAFNKDFFGLFVRIVETVAFSMQKKNHVDKSVHKFYNKLRLKYNI